MTRVVFVLQEPTPYRTPQLAAFAAKPGVDATMVYASRTVQQRTWDVPPPGNGVLYLSGWSLPTTRVLHHEYALTPQIWPLLGRLRPQVLVIGGWSLMATQLAILWARTHRVPYLLMSDNNLLEPRPLWIRGVKRAVLRAIVPQAAGWVVPGMLGREHILHYGAHPGRIVTFPLTIDVEAAERRTDELRARRTEIRARLEIAEHDVVVLHAGRLIAQKGVDVLVRATAEAREAGAPLRLLLVGAGPEETSLRTLADTLDVASTFTGFLAGEKLAEAYVAADIFALLSRRETWGVVVNEAAAAGLPLVLSRAVGASADLLEPGRNGELVESEDVGAAASALSALALDAERRRAYGLRSRELIEDWGYGPGLDALAQLVTEVAR
jgi:glycosyltransferase involved in cell wall biosynthesis